ncbi:hypothetical protein NT6N_00800 [Oceaniferula spumae]|uniref:NACHT domain-containing protein n=1 Tax=Oceaniferula spumae TaxID=2979115 RepID=A0AAT9FGD1_9BACT
MSEPHDLTHLDPNSFEQMVNMLSLKVLGSGHTGFAPGADGGRDGYFEGTAPYPSQKENWKGKWYIQSKFHKPHLSKDPQKWLLQQITKEITAFEESESREWPNNWIIATNVDPSGTPQTGAFDKARKLVSQANPKLKNNFHIWGGRKIIDLLALNPKVADYYGHFLTPGHVLKELYDSLEDDKASLKDIIRYLVIREFETHQFTKLDQAGSESDNRPGVHRLFVDLPFRCDECHFDGLIARELLRTSSRVHSIQPDSDDPKWRQWNRHPSRSRVWFILGGPGNGKSTTGQYFSQLQRASLILDWDGDPISFKLRDAAREIKGDAIARGHWVESPRIPISIELRDYAQWFGKQPDNTAKGVLPYLALQISAYVNKDVSPATIKRALGSQRWFIAFDGLDEVPNDVKDKLSSHIKEFIEDTAIECNSDAHFLCTSRPQGYSGQFDSLEAAVSKLVPLTPDKALECAEPVIRIGRSEVEAEKGVSILRSSIASPAVASLMTTPLQSHIMAVVVRDGKKPPERRWQLFENFYQVIKRREANRDLPDERIAKLLREEDLLLRTIHNRLGFMLHAKSETSEGAQTALSREQFTHLAKVAVEEMKSGFIEETLDTLVEATATRLVLVNTPDDGNNLRFDIRQLQEFFAAEFIHDAATPEEFRERIYALAGDAHWREVFHFLLSAMIEARRQGEINELVVALETLNESGGNELPRPLSRRLARGALLAARLFQDGVLEQDKRIRAKFRTPLEPLIASPDISDLGSLIGINHHETRKWLISFCLERLNEASPSESIGGAIILSRLVKDHDPEASECYEAIRSKPADFQAILFGSWTIRSARNSPYSKWLAKLAYQQLKEMNWYELGHAGVRSALGQLPNDPDSISKFLLEVDPEAPEHLPHTIQILRHTTGIVPEEVKIEQTVSGISRCVSDYDWQGGKFIEKSLASMLRHSDSYVWEKRGGLFGVVVAILRFANSSSLENYSMLYDVFLPAPESIKKALPRNLQTYLPFEDQPEETACKLNEEQFTSWIETIPRPHVFRREEIAPETMDWKALLKEWPKLGVRVALVSWWIDQEAEVDYSSFKESLADAIISEPQALTAVNILGWGELISNIPERADELRKAFLSISPELDTSSHWHFHRRGTLHPFEILLPGENTHIPAVVSATIQHFFYRNEISHFSVSPPVHVDFGDVKSLIKAFFPNGTAVKHIHISKDKPSDKDGYTALLWLLHPDIETELRSVAALLKDAYKNSRNRSYLEYLLTYLYMFKSEQDNIAVQLVSDLLDLTKNSLSHRELFQPILNHWRETSTSPAHKAKAIERWFSH